MLAERPDQMVVVDYNCTQGTQAWVRANHPGVVTVKAADPKGFSRSRARNIGAAASDGELIFFADADAQFPPGVVDWVRKNLAPGEFVRFAGATLVCERTAFEKIGGFDEVFRVWGKEDNDLVERLVRAGYRNVPNPGFHFLLIDHPDSMRAHGPKNRDLPIHMLISTIYYRMKKHALDNGYSASRAERQAMYDSIVSQIEDRPFNLFRLVRWSYGAASGLRTQRALIVRKLKPGREWSVRMM